MTPESIKTLFDCVGSFIKTYGFWGILAIFAVLVFQDPDRLLKIKVLFYSFYHWAFKGGTKSYISSKMSLKLNKFFNNSDINHIFTSNTLRFKIKWVRSSKDPILSSEGTIILNLKNTQDQTRNILTATKVSLPLIVCPGIRRTINTNYQEAIDLTLVKKMADYLGQNAYPVFEKYFLEPIERGNSELKDIYYKLVTVDNYGIFSPVLLEELNLISSKFHLEGISFDITEDLFDFIHFLLEIATRGIGEDVELLYTSKYFNIGFILVAKKKIKSKFGSKPYIERIGKDFKSGCERVYVVGFSVNRVFFKKIYQLLKNDQRYNISEIIQIKSRTPNGDIDKIDFLSVEKNKEHSENYFKEIIDFHKIVVGSIVKGKVLDVFNDMAIVSVFGVTSFIYQDNCSWSRLKNCADVYSKNKEFDFLVKKVNEDKERLILSNKFPEENPLYKNEPPDLNCIINVKIIEEFKTYFISKSQNDLEIIIPKTELSWSQYVNYSDYNDVYTNLIIYKINKNDGIVLGSLKRNLDNPWTNILEIYPRNSKVNVRVLSINERGVHFVMPNGLIATISNEKIMQTKSSVNLLKDKEIEVIVDKILIKKKEIHVII